MRARHHSGTVLIPDGFLSPTLDAFNTRQSCYASRTRLGVVAGERMAENAGRRYGRLLKTSRRFDLVGSRGAIFRAFLMFPGTPARSLNTSPQHGRSFFHRNTPNSTLLDFLI